MRENPHPHSAGRSPEYLQGSPVLPAAVTLLQYSPEEIIGARLVEERHARLQLQHVRHAEYLPCAQAFQLQQALGNLTETVSQHRELQVGIGLCHTADAIIRRHAASTQAAQLGIDVPHPEAHLPVMQNLPQDFGVCLALSRTKCSNE